MYLKQITLDGFKSYAKKVILKNFDSHFNAITGLNGTGKSNILDAICFVLGLSKISKVRVQNLQGLIYKEGQSGVTKASVTLLFDNSSKVNSPPGYEDFSEFSVTRQVISGGKTKYLINGCAAQAARVQNLFQSIHLNINNPHFIIMQGSIAKVLNMKPVEVLEMIEEVAGTRMFESKKGNAKKIIEKKQTKFEEIENILKNEIEPKLSKLDKEKKIFKEWQRNLSQLEETKKVVEMAQSLEEKKKLENTKFSIIKLENILEEKNKELKEKEKEKEKFEETKKKVKKKENRNLSEMKVSLKERNNEKIKEEAKLKYKEEEFKAFENNFQNKVKVFKKTKSEQKEHKKIYNKEKKEIENFEKRIETIKEKLEILNSKGKENKEEIEREILLRTETEMKLKNNERKNLLEKIQNFEKDLKEKEILQNRNFKELKNFEEEFKSLKERESERKRIIEFPFSLERKLNEMKRMKISLKRDIEENEQKIKSLSNEFKTSSSLLNINKEFIEKGNDRNQKINLSSKKLKLSSPSSLYNNKDNNKEIMKRLKENIKGTIAEIITIKSHEFKIAIESSAGGKLYQLVLSDAQTGKELLKRNLLSRRCTMIPLDKVSVNKIEKRVLEEIRKVCKDSHIYLASDLVESKEDCRKAIDFVFGKLLICASKKTASSVAFDKRFGFTCTTLEGDILNPAGTLSGGFRSQTKSVLNKMEELRTLVSINEMKEKEKEVLCKEIEQLDREVSKAEEAAKVAGEEEVRFEGLKVLVEANSKESLEREIGKLKESLGSLKESLESLNEGIKGLEKKIEEMKGFLSSSSSNNNNNIDSNKEKEKEEKNILEKEKIKIRKELNKRENSFLKIEVKEKDFENRILSYEKEILEMEKELLDKGKEIETLKFLVKKKMEEVKEIEERIKSDQKTLNIENEIYLKNEKNLERNEKEINKLIKEIGKFKKELQNLKINFENIEKNLENYSFDFSSERNEILSFIERFCFENLYSVNEYKEKETFNIERELKEIIIKAQKRLHELEKQKEKLSSKVNRKVFAMHERTTKEFEDLISKKNKVIKDKAKLASVIKELDKRKEKALCDAWKGVDNNFGSIFKTLLPNNFCKLQPLNRNEMGKGMEIKVRLGETWKESLTELSGGQRSLLSLSLILSLLLFKPAPIYILDEVDAALDLSHTQNIGVMFKKHFGGSQFLVVSLKEGLFHNANVVFRTKFVDGVSGVVRTVKNK